jgi:pimeloyl-ACP methyl ester carboxylesterase
MAAAELADLAPPARFLAEAQSDRYPDWKLDDWLVFAKRVAKLNPNGRIAFDYDMRIAEPLKVPGGESGFDLWTAFAGLKGIPSLIVHGELSDLLTAETVARMIAENPAMAKVTPDPTTPVPPVTIPRIGHAPTLDEPEAVAAIDALLERVK